MPKSSRRWIPTKTESWRLRR